MHACNWVTVAFRTMKLSTHMETIKSMKYTRPHACKQQLTSQDSVYALKFHMLTLMKMKLGINLHSITTIMNNNNTYL